MDFEEFVLGQKRHHKDFERMEEFRSFLLRFKNPPLAQVIESQETDLYSGKIPHLASAETIHTLDLMVDFGFLVKAKSLVGTNNYTYALTPKGRAIGSLVDYKNRLIRERRNQQKEEKKEKSSSSTKWVVGIVISILILTFAVLNFLK
jgi:hypothetical protein